MADIQIVLEFVGIGLAFLFFAFDKLDLFKGKVKKLIGLVYLVTGFYFLVLAIYFSLK